MLHCNVTCGTFLHTVSNITGRAISHLQSLLFLNDTFSLELTTNDGLLLLAGLTAAKKMVACRQKSPHALSVKEWFSSYQDIAQLELSTAQIHHADINLCFADQLIYYMYILYFKSVCALFYVYVWLFLWIWISIMLTEFLGSRGIGKGRMGCTGNSVHVCCFLSVVCFYLCILLWLIVIMLDYDHFYSLLFFIIGII